MDRKEIKKYQIKLIHQLEVKPGWLSKRVGISYSYMYKYINEEEFILSTKVMMRIQEVLRFHEADELRALEIDWEQVV